jgi:RNA polymerase sigma-70 factor, ECF subfamily
MQEGSMTASGLLERARTAEERGDDEPAGSGGDEEFARVLYQRHRPQLHCYVVRLTRDEQWAEDIVQATLVRAWRARLQLNRGDAAIRSWLFTVAYRIFVDDYRSRSIRPVALMGEALVFPDPRGDEAERLAWSITLRDALSALSAPHREAIVQVYYLSRTVDEAASVLGISPGTVKSRLHYALRALRRQLPPALRHGHAA